MRTTFSPDQLKDPMVSESEAILRKCVHCGFCTATCPTYVTLGNELDSPRGRIYLKKKLQETKKKSKKKEKPRSLRISPPQRSKKNILIAIKKISKKLGKR